MNHYFDILKLEQMKALAKIYWVWVIWSRILQIQIQNTNTNILLAQTQLPYNNWQRPKVKLQFMFMNRKYNNMTLL